MRHKPAVLLIVVLSASLSCGGADSLGPGATPRAADLLSLQSALTRSFIFSGSPLGESLVADYLPLVFLQVDDILEAPFAQLAGRNASAIALLVNYDLELDGERVAGSSFAVIAWDGFEVGDETPSKAVSVVVWDWGSARTFARTFTSLADPVPARGGCSFIPGCGSFSRTLWGAGTFFDSRGPTLYHAGAGTVRFDSTVATGSPRDCKSGNTLRPPACSVDGAMVYAAVDFQAQRVDLLTPTGEPRYQLEPTQFALPAIIVSLEGDVGNSDPSATATAIELKGFEFTGTDFKIGITSTQLFRLIARDRDGNRLTRVPISWSSSAPSVATVEDTPADLPLGPRRGIWYLQPRSLGTATLTARAGEAITSFKVQVCPSARPFVPADCPSQSAGPQSEIGTTQYPPASKP